VRLYHETAPKNVGSILADGFHDSGPVRTAAGEIYGVFVADQPPQFGRGWALIYVDADLTDHDLAPYAWNTRAWPLHGNRYREWCVPAALLNRCGRPHVIGSVA